LLLNAKWTIAQLYRDDVRYVLDQHAKFEFHSFSSLKQQSIRG